jgi:gliding motility-associated-like protein/uncharacterized repeat protein (TIGR01451 family)
LVSVVGGPIVLAPVPEDTPSFTASYTVTQADIDAGTFSNQAVASGTPPIGADVTDTSDDDSYVGSDPTVTLLCQLSAIALVKTGVFNDEDGDGCADTDTITYTFTVTNEDNTSISAVTVTDDLLGGLLTAIPTGDANGDMILDLDETWIYVQDYTITQDDIDAGNVTNTATVNGTGIAGPVSDLSGATINDDDPTVTEICQESGLSLEKIGVFNDEDGDGFGQVGETISYTFIVTNSGSVTIYNIDIEDPLPGIVVAGGPIAALAPGEVDNSTFTATYIITQEDLTATVVKNQAIAIGETIGGTLVEDDSDDPNNPNDVDNNGDGDPDDVTNTIVRPGVLNLLTIFNGITPDGDGKNEYFEIQGIQDYPNNTMQIFNRWGVLVYETTGYENDEFGNVFKGYSNGRAILNNDELLPTGTYFYILNFSGPELPNDENKETYTGYLYINR